MLWRLGFLLLGWYWPICWQWCRGCSAIDFSAVPNFDDLDQSMVIVHGIDNAIITLPDSIGVLACQFLAAGRPWRSREVLDPLGDSLKICFGDFPQLAFSGFLDEDAIKARHASSPRIPSQMDGRVLCVGR